MYCTTCICTLVQIAEKFLGFMKSGKWPSATHYFKTNPCTNKQNTIDVKKRSHNKVYKSLCIITTKPNALYV